MQGTGLSFSPSMLRTVALPQGQRTIQAPPVDANINAEHRDQQQPGDHTRQRKHTDWGPTQSAPRSGEYEKAPRFVLKSSRFVLKRTCKKIVFGTRDTAAGPRSIEKKSGRAESGERGVDRRQ